MITDNPIINEVRRVREEILESYGGDIEAMMRDMMKKQYESGREVVPPPERKTPPVTTAGSDEGRDAKEA